MDDVLDFEGTSSSLGKPANADIRSGIATAPLLYACDERPELVPLVERKFAEKGDIEHALSFIHESSAIERSRNLAREHVEMAAAAVCQFEHNEAADGLLLLLDKVLKQ